MVTRLNLPTKMKYPRRVNQFMQLGAGWAASQPNKRSIASEFLVWNDIWVLK